MRYRLLLIILVLLLFPVHSAQAADIVVGTGTLESCTESAFDNALNSIQAGANGTLSFNCGGAASIVFSSQKTISKDVTIQGSNLITLSGGNSTRLFSVAASGKLTLQEIQLTNGYIASDGGAIYNAGELILNNTTIRNSKTDLAHSGGAIVSYGLVTINDSLFEGNSAGNGGALYFRFEGGDAVINNSIVRNNQTLNADGWGGGILLWDGADVVLHNTIFTGNHARQGGAIHNPFSNSSITLDQGSQITGNINEDEDNFALKGGGGIYNQGSLQIMDSTLSGNYSTGDGGAIENHGIANLLRVAIYYNLASNGSGIYNSGNLTLTNVTLTQNGWWGLYTYGPATATNVTFSKNWGSNIYVYQSPITLKNVVLEIDPTGGFVNCQILPSGSVNSAGFNLSSDASCQLNQTGDQNGVDSMLGELADNGGLTLTHLPLPGSPLIDAGTSLSAPSTDQRNLPRPVGLAYDIGAVERQAVEWQSSFLPVILR